MICGMASSSLQLSFSAQALEFSTRSSSRVRHFQILCSSVQFNGEDGEDDTKNCKDAFLVERYGNGTAKRYMLDDDSQLKSVLEVHGARSSRQKEFQPSDMSWLPYTIKNFILPAGFPGSVSDDYLQYMLLQFPTNVTGWICYTLVTSSLLKAIGVGSSSGINTAASAAAIRWVSKDGIGALGRLFIGGRFGNLFDDDPKQWRMYADFIGSAGSIFDLTTQLYPAYFLPLASLGNLTKLFEGFLLRAVARGLKDPSSRVIQNHFGMSGNLGEIAAKEEVWEVGAQLVGLALGIIILNTPGLVKSFPALTTTWMSVRLLHLWLRYLSLSVLQFNTINLKRARLLVKSHILHSCVLGRVACNREENILTWEAFIKPQITFGVPLEKLVGGERSVAKVKALVRLYTKEKYFLTVNQQKGDFEVFVSFKVGATSMSVLRSVWQTYWLHENWTWSGDELDQLARSLGQMEVRFEDFLQQLDLAGWHTHQINLKVPQGISIDEIMGTP